MTKIQRIINIILSVFLVLLAVLMMVDFELGYLMSILVISLYLVFYGIRQLVYYFTMARHMVGGKMILYIGIVALDFGIFSGTLLSVPQVFILMYLVLTFALTGVASFLRGLEAKRYDSPGWLLRMIYGILNIAVVLISVIFVRSVSVLVIIFAVALIYSAVIRFISSFRQNAIVYIQ